MGSGFSKMKKQARLMQEQFSQIKQNMDSTLVEGTSGNGLVQVTLNGNKDLKKITIHPDCLSDVEALQDLILAAFENGSEKLTNQKTPSLPFF
jgi:DNA-binding YbaB/EbfC family protein